MKTQKEPASIKDRLIEALVHINQCPECLGTLNAAWECLKCGVNAQIVMQDIADKPENASCG